VLIHANQSPSPYEQPLRKYNYFRLNQTGSGLTKPEVDFLIALAALIHKKQSPSFYDQPLRKYKLLPVMVDCHLVFCTVEILPADGVQVSNTCHSAKFSQDRSSHYGDIVIYQFLQDGGCLPSWICWTHVRTTRKQYSTVFTAVQSLVAIGAVVSIILRF